MSEVTFLEGFPVEIFELFDKSLLFTLIPASIAIAAQMISNMYDPIA